MIIITKCFVLLFYLIKADFYMFMSGEALANQGPALLK